MSGNTNPNVVTDGLVLCLDSYNEQSYLGEPTTNVVHYTNLDTGWSKGYNTNIVFNELPPPIGIDSTTVSFDDLLGGGGYWYSYGDYAPQNASTTYTVSVYVQTVQSTPVSIAMYTADNSESGRYFSEPLYFTREGETNHLGGVINNNIPDVNGWIRIVWTTFTSTSTAQSDSLSFMFGGFNDPATASNRTSLCAPQMEAKSHATKYVGESANNGTVTTRSATDGWQDLSGRGNHADLTQLSYSATNVPGTNVNDFSFDGTDDYVALPAGSNFFGTNDFTVSLWTGNLSTDGVFFSTMNTGVAASENWVEIRPYTATQLVFDLSDGTNTSTALSGDVSATDLRDGNSHHLVFVWDRSDSVSWYLDGVLKGSADISARSGDLGDSNSLNLMRRPNGVGEAEGDIYVFHIYNRGLSATEILQNYNAHKGRYGL